MYQVCVITNNPIYTKKRYTYYVVYLPFSLQHILLNNHFCFPVIASPTMQY